MLGRAVGLATQVAFQPSYIDKPPGAASSFPLTAFSHAPQMARSISSSFPVASTFR
jgi:hypothetical protein